MNRMPDSDFAESKNNLKPPLNPVTLTFRDPDLGRIFSNYATADSLGFVRISLAFAIGLYIAFAFLDPVIMSGVVLEITYIRIVSILFFIGVLYVSTTDWGFDNFQMLMGAVVLFASSGIIGMILLAESIGGYLYYAALILAIIYAHNLLRLRFIFATITTWLVIWIYAIATLWLDTTPFYIYLNNMFFLVSANFLGMFASYWLEYYMKAVFWKERMLQIKTNLLEAEYNRKSDELNAARELQLSMLPQSSPLVKDYQFSFSMNPASEVGGDYYDYVIEEDGTVTFAIGDATGHGLRASVIVTAIKLLFSEHAAKTELAEFLKRASRSINLMGLKKIFLAFAIGRLKGDVLEFAGAGMPPALVFRHKTGRVDEINLKGFPLGSNLKYPYQKTEIVLGPGDMVLLMTDGFPELNNADGEMIGYENMIRIFLQSASGTPSRLIQQLNEYAAAWKNGNSQNDDITFFAIKRIAKPDIINQEPSDYVETHNNSKGR